MLDFERLSLLPNHLTYSKMGCQWKDNIHIFHLVPSSALCDLDFDDKNLKEQENQKFLKTKKNVIP